VELDGAARPVGTEALDAQCQGDPQRETRRRIGALPGAHLPAQLAEPAAAQSRACAVTESARWGAMELTGGSDAPPTAPDFSLAYRIRGALSALAQVTGRWGIASRSTPAGC
jgi:hypothetical protein